MPSSVRMQLMPLESGAAAGGGAAPAVPVNRGAGGSTGSGASAPECVRTGEEDGPDDWNSKVEGSAAKVPMLCRRRVGPELLVGGPEMAVGRLKMLMGNAEMLAGCSFMR